MKTPTRNNGSLIRKTTALGLVPLLLLIDLQVCAAKHMSDWSKVQAVPRGTKTQVLLYKDEVPAEVGKMKGRFNPARQIRGRFDSATTDSITLRLKDGQTHTLQKPAVQKVLTRRPFSKRWPGWVALGVGGLIVGLMGDLDGPASNRFFAQVVFNLPIAAAFFYGSRMKSIYEVPPKHRTRPYVDKQSGAQSKTLGKPEGKPRQD